MSNQSGAGSPRWNQIRRAMEYLIAVATLLFAAFVASYIFISLPST
jgi:hypothetical protein